jgi:hypothetical protein
MRYSLSEKILDGNDISFYDLSTIPWSEFPYELGYEEYSLSEVDIPRFFKLMIEKYNNEDYWDIILILNNIIDPIEDLYPTKIIKLPNLTELTAFIRKYQE